MNSNKERGVCPSQFSITSSPPFSTKKESMSFRRSLTISESGVILMPIGITQPTLS
jgi:hypothetical protein